MLGYTEEEIGRLTLWSSPRDYRESNWQLVSELLKVSEDSFRSRSSTGRKDGSLIWVSNNVSSFRAPRACLV